MKRLLLLCFTAFFSYMVIAQVSSQPTFVTTNFEGEFSIIFDAKQGNGGMIGADNCYAHTGVITTESTSDSDWKHAPTWKDNDDKYKMESIGTDLWKLTITGGMKEYYQLDEGEVVTKLAFVFRTDDASKEGKTASNTDIYYELYSEDDKLVLITQPADNGIYTMGDAFTIKGEATIQMATLELSIGEGEDAQLLKNTTASNIIESAYTIENTGNITFTCKAVDAEANVYTDTVKIYVKGADIDKDTPDYLQEGINYIDENTVGLVFRAPHNQSMYVLGDFNNWELNETYHMYRDSIFNDEGEHINTLFWCIFDVEEPTKKYAFQYLIDGKMQISDPYAEIVLDPWNDPSITNLLDKTLPKYPKKGEGLVSILQISNPNKYEWEVTDFKAPDKEDLVIYELHIRDFSQNSTLREVIDRLDYIEKLGINAIELMPITEFDGNDSWGYNPNHFFAYDKAYGTDNVYKEFIDECHKRGIAVIIDMVFNHATGICPFAKLYWEGNATADKNPWFNRVACHPYNVFHDFNHEYEGTRQYFKRVLEYWLTEYKVDGYRMDLTKGLTQTNSGNDVGKWGRYDASRIAILKDYYQTVIDTNPDAYFILEHLADYSEEKVLADAGMLLWRNMNNSYSQAAMGYASSSHFVDSNKKGGMFANGWVGYAESHDEERNMYKAMAYGDGNLQNNHEERMSRVPAIIAFSQLLPGPKMMWQFGELGYDYSINHCSSGKIDEECRTYRKPNPWKLGWEEDEARMNAYKQSSKVINLRSKYPQFFREEFVTATNCYNSSWNSPRRIDVNYTNADNTGDNIDIIILANFSAISTVATAIDVPHTGTWYNYMTGAQMNIYRKNQSIRLQPGELLILTSRKLDNTVSIEEAMATKNQCLLFPTITSDFVTVVSSEIPQSIKVYNLVGNLMTQNTDSETISLVALPKGTYLVQVNINNNVSTHKIIKQ